MRLKGKRRARKRPRRVKRANRSGERVILSQSLKGPAQHEASDGGSKSEAFAMF